MSFLIVIFVVIGLSTVVIRTCMNKLFEIKLYLVICDIDFYIFYKRLFLELY